MNKNELKALREVRYKEDIIKGSDLENQTPRTLLKGYCKGGEVWHVYLENGEIKTVMDDREESKYYPVSIETNDDYIPDKRLKPEYCDFEFCKLLREKYNVSLPFTTFKEKHKKYEGKTYYAPLEGSYETEEIVYTVSQDTFRFANYLLLSCKGNMTVSNIEETVKKLSLDFSKGKSFEDVLKLWDMATKNLDLEKQDVHDLFDSPEFKAFKRFLIAEKMFIRAS